MKTQRENEVEEPCPHCDNVVELQNVFVAQICPECGNWIMPCSICEHRMPEMDSAEYCPKCDDRMNQINIKKTNT